MTTSVESTTTTDDLIVRTYAVGYADGTQLRWHRHDWHQLVYATNGVLVVDTESGTWTVPPTRAVWIPAGITHRLTARGRVDLRSLYVRHDVPGADRLQPGVIEVSPLLRELVLHVVTRGALSTDDPSAAFLARFVLDQIEAIDVAPLTLPIPTDPLCEAVGSALRANPGVDLDAVAALVGAAKRTIERRIRSQTGMSLGQWRQRLQLTMAIELLASGVSVTETGRRVGYASTSAFVASFRRQLGTTPGRYFKRA